MFAANFSKPSGIFPAVFLLAGKFAAGAKIYATGLVWQNRRMNSATRADTLPTWFERVATPLGNRDFSRAGFSRALMLLALLGLIIRTAFFAEHSHSPAFGVPTLDQKYYDTVARMILAGDDLRELHGFKPLLYPMFLATCYELGGTGGIALAIFFQHLLGVATGVFVAWLGAKLFRNRLAGILGGILFLLAPLPLCFEGELLVEASYTFLIGAILALHFVAAERRGKSALAWWLAAGALLAVAAQERSNILIFAIVYPALVLARGFFWHHRETNSPLAGLAGLLAMMIFFGAVNARQAGQFQLIPGAGGVNLFLGNKRTATGMTAAQTSRVAYGERYEDPIEIWSRQEYATAMRAHGHEPETNPAAISKYWTQRAVEEMRADPAAWLKLLVKKTWLLAWNAEIPNNKAFAFEQENSFWLRWLPVRWVWLFALAPVGIWAAKKAGDRNHLFVLLVFLIFYAAGTVVFFISDRYRYPLWPGMAMLAGGALLHIFQAFRHFKISALWLPAAIAIMVCVSLPNWYGIQLPNFARDYLFRSMAWYEKGHFAEALADADRSLKLDATDVSAWQQRGNALFGLNQLAAAGDAFQTALKLNPDEARTWNNFGNCLAATGKISEALAAFQRATECQPPSRNAFLGMTFIELRTGQLAAATSALDQYEKMGRAPDAVSLALRAYSARQNGDAKKADELERQARALDANAAQWAMDQVTPPAK